MAFHGDLSSFPLPELLQWLDGSRKTGTLSLVWEGVERRLSLLSGQVVGLTASGQRERVLRLLELGGICNASSTQDALRAVARGEEVGQSFAAHGISPAPVMEVAREELLAAVVDLTRAEAGTFHWTEGVERSEVDWIPAAVGLRELLFESLRWVDEAPDVARTLSGEGLRVHARTTPGPHLSAMQRIVLTLASEGIPLSRLQLALGTSRAATQRRVFDLMRLKLVAVEGTPEPELDPVTDMLEKGATLVRERQYEAAALVAAALRASDPVDRRVREFSRMVEREHIAAIYGQLSPLDVLVLREPGAGRLTHLRPEERQVLGQVNGSWDVATVVLASPLGELATLSALSRLIRQGVLGRIPA